MAYIVPTRPHTYEVRETRSTPSGPRSRTLVSFRELTDEVIEKAKARASKPLSEEDLRDAAARVGAPAPGPPIDEAGRTLLRLLARGKGLDPMLRRMLLDGLRAESPTDRPADAKASVTDNARSAAQWIGVGLSERGEALQDLLKLADALPVRPRPEHIDFPRLRST